MSDELQDFGYERNEVFQQIITNTLAKQTKCKFQSIEIYTFVLFKAIK